MSLLFVSVKFLVLELPDQKPFVIKIVLPSKTPREISFACILKNKKFPAYKEPKDYQNVFYGDSQKNQYYSRRLKTTTRRDSKFFLRPHCNSVAIFLTHCNAISFFFSLKRISKTFSRGKMDFYRIGQNF